jgi:hypothetical protein
MIKQTIQTHQNEIKSKKMLFKDIGISIIYNKKINFSNSFIEMISKNLADYYLVHLNIENLTISSHKNLKSAILDFKKKRIKKLLYVEVGNLLYWNIRFFNGVNNMITEKPYVKFIGHILDYGNGSFYIHPQMFLIDVDWAFDNKIFTIENEDKDIQWDGYVINRSEENFHGNYTPISVNATNTKKTFFGRGLGYNILDKLSETSSDFMPWSEEVRNEKNFLYPSVKSEIITQKSVVLKKMDMSKAYVANTEKIFLSNVNNFNTIVTPASGISPLILGYKNNSKKIVLYDFSTVALSFYETLLEKWDGKDYKTFVHNNFNIKFKGKDFYLGSDFIDNDNLKINELGEDFTKWFLQNKGLFILCKFDIYDKTTWKRLILNIKNNDEIFFNLSNLLHYFPTSMLFSISEIKENFELFLRELEKHNLLEKIYFHGVNPFQCKKFSGKIDSHELEIKYNNKLLWR